jgi:hypothetical protein
MPEFRAAGVQIEETSGGSSPVLIVRPPVIDTETARALVAAMKPLLENANPGWTHSDDHDPGVTLVQLLAFVAEGLLYRSDADTERRRRAIQRAADDLKAVAGECATDTASLRRLHYYAGRLLDAADLQLEQDYYREKLRRHNRNILGYGIVSGLEVTVDPDGTHVVIEPGYAIDPCGEELAIPVRVEIELPHERDAAFVTLCYGERRCDPSATQGNAGNGGYIEEICIVAIAGEPSPTALAIARLVWSNGCWTTDATFVPRRIGRP